MKSKRLTVAILLTILLTLPVFSQESKNYRKIVQDEFGIESNKNYNGEDVIEFIAICLEEKDNAIETAYYEGYKKAAEEFKPDLEYYKLRAISFEDNYNIMKERYDKKTKNGILYSISTFSVGFFLGGAAGGIIGYKLHF